MKILIPYDGSDSAKRAVEYAVKLAKGHKFDDITLLTVACGDNALARGVIFNPEEFMASCQAHFTASLEKAKELFSAEGIEVNAVVASGDPATVIVETVNSGGYDKVIMGTRGLSKLSSVFLGSVSLKVVSSVQVPITFIH